MKKLDITGIKYGRLTAINPIKSEGRRSIWSFVCDCGKEKNICMEQVRDGRTRSCGCLRREETAARSITHGHSIGRKESKELKSYNHAKSRCFNRNDEKYPQYGGRGITMCKEWADDAAKFILDMGACPDRYTIDRIDVDGNYEPGNCQWASAAQQARNKTNNVLVEHQGITMILKDYAALVGVNYKSLHRRIKYDGNTLEQATAALS